MIREETPAHPRQSRSSKPKPDPENRQPIRLHKLTLNPLEEGGRRVHPNSKKRTGNRVRTESRLASRDQENHRPDMLHSFCPGQLSAPSLRHFVRRLGGRFFAAALLLASPGALRADEGGGGGGKQGTSWRERLYTPTLITRLGDTWFIVVCWHHRILFHDGPAPDPD